MVVVDAVASGSGEGRRPPLGPGVLRKEQHRAREARRCQTDALYADRGAAIQVYLSDEFCELETLGPLRGSRRTAWRPTAALDVRPAQDER
jgi:hypothetical protein